MNKSIKNLNALFESLESPNEIAPGDYKVRMIWGFPPNFSWLGHKKVISVVGSETVGHNKILGFISFGFFRAEQWNRSKSSRSKFFLNYNGDRLLGNVRDELRILEPEQSYLGCFNVTDSENQLKPLGYFTLTRIN